MPHAALRLAGAGARGVGPILVSCVARQLADGGRSEQLGRVTGPRDHLTPRTPGAHPEGGPAGGQRVPGAGGDAGQSGPGAYIRLQTILTLKACNCRRQLQAL